MRVRHVFQVNIIADEGSEVTYEEACFIRNHLRGIINEGLEGKAYEGRELMVGEIYPTNSYEEAPRGI